MIYLYVFLTVLMFVDCVILVFLVLLQLPKKEAGAGMAFGGGATDALFGAGSGNVLTKITKYAVGIFFALAIIMAFSTSHLRGPSGAETLTDALNKSGSGVAPLTPMPSTPAAAPAASNASPHVQLISNLPPAAAPGTNK
jgi:preprotein translocase subunit SecG